MVTKFHVLDYESDDDDQEEMNEENMEATIEAAYRDDPVGQDDDDTEKVQKQKQTRSNFELQDGFMKNLSAATSVSFTSSKLSFTLEVGAILCQGILHVTDHFIVRLRCAEATSS